MKRDLKELSPQELEEVFRARGEPAWRVREIRHWLFRRGASTIEEMTSLPRKLREELAAEYTVHQPEVQARRQASDGTVKLLLGLADGARCECVLIPEGERLTLCLSSQAGCALGCLFCRTGKGGLERSLTAAEIVDQWLAARREAGGERRITNLVYMGMGEPLLNEKALYASLEIFLSDEGAGLSPGRVTVSTAGIVPALERLRERFPRIGIALSLNAPDEELRGRLMPVNRRHPLGEVVEALRRLPRTRERPTVEYVLLGGVNDAPAQARKLAALLRGVRCKINLIPFNAHPDLPFSSPSGERVAAFAGILEAAGYTVLRRRSMGGEIAAACGQLAADES